MNPVVNVTGEDAFEIAIAIAAAFFGVLLLRALNRKMHIFTRGTISFILTALIIFTAVDTVAIMNGIRNNQATNRALADYHTVTSIVCSWIDQGAEVAAHQVSGDINQDALLTDLKAAEEDIAIDLERKNARGETVKDLKLVALSVDRYGRTEMMSRNSKRFSFSAIVDDGTSYHRLTGGVSIRHRSDKGIDIVNFKSGLSKTFRGTKRQVAGEYNRADSYKSDDYQFDSRRYDLVRRVAHRDD